jgi:hypothetical protein
MNDASKRSSHSRSVAGVSRSGSAVMKITLTRVRTSGGSSSSALAIMAMWVGQMSSQFV